MSFLGGLLSSKTDTGDVKDFVSSPGLQTNNPYTQQFDQNAAAQQALAAQLAGYANNGAQNAAAAQQQAYINQLQNQANGNGPSVAQAVLNNSLQQNVANTNALAASQKGNSNPVLAQRMAMQQNAQAGQQAAQTAAVAKMQEQLNAQGQLGNALSTMRGQDLQNSSMYNQLAQGYQSLGQNAMNSGLNAGNANLSSQMNANSINANVATQNTASQNQVTGGLLGGAGAVLGAVAGKAKGGFINGKAKVVGDSEVNDTVPTMLSPGEIVIPRSKSSDPEKAKEFIDHLMSSKKKSTDQTGYSKVLEAHRMMKEMNERLKKLEAKVGKN